jgi:phenylacetic acid degradation operon negative regulatory protein
MTNIVNSCNIEQPNPRRVVLNLLRVAGGGVLAAPEALKAGALFGISENSMRVTLARLSRAGLVEAAERGLYRLGPAGSAIAADVGGWRDVESRLVPWRGRWVAAATGGLPRSDRRSLRIRTRALSMLGMRELDHGLFLRPDNLSGGVAGVRARLAGLGLEEGAAVFAIDDLDAARQAAAMALWASLGGDDYLEAASRLDRWAEGAQALPLDIAARESFLLGDAAIRRIVFDPLLPAPLADARARSAFIAAAIRFDDLGRRIWDDFLSRG